MRNHLNKLLVILCIITCTFGVTACSSSNQDLGTKMKYDEVTIQSIAEFMVKNVLVSLNDSQADQLMALSDAQIEQMFSKQVGFSVDGAAFRKGLESWQSVRNDIGNISDMKSTTVTADGANVYVTALLAGKNRNCEIKITFDDKNKVTGLVIEPEYLLGERIEKVCTDNFSVVVIAFAVLLLISLSLSVMTFCRGGGRADRKKQADKDYLVNQTISQIIQKEELSDDLELVAVITAAIAEYEKSNGGTGEGFVVRSIKKSGNRKWQKA